MAEKKLDKSVSIIILSWNTKKLLKRCLESLEQESKGAGEQEIIVVDNGSTDGSVEMLKELQTSNSVLRTIFNQKNLGFGAGNNQGMREATGDYLLLLNSDTIVKNGAPLKMAKFMEKHVEVGVVGCKLLNPDNSPQPSAGPFPNLWVSFIMLFAEHWLGDLVRSSFPKVKEVDWVMGAALMIRREVIKKAGLMDEGIFMYMDEVEWCYRVKKAGFKVMFYPGAEIIHLFGGSSKTGRRDPILNIYRGLLYFYRKHYPSWQLPIFKTMLKLKATGALLMGKVTNNSYLKKTYAEALKITQN